MMDNQIENDVDKNKKAYLAKICKNLKILYGVFIMLSILIYIVVTYEFMRRAGNINNKKYIYIMVTNTIWVVMLFIGIILAEKEKKSAFIWGIIVGLMQILSCNIVNFIIMGIPIIVDCIVSLSMYNEANKK